MPNYGSLPGLDQPPQIFQYPKSLQHQTFTLRGKVRFNVEPDPKSSERGAMLLTIETIDSAVDRTFASVALCLLFHADEWELFCLMFSNPDAKTQKVEELIRLLQGSESQP